MKCPPSRTGRGIKCPGYARGRGGGCLSFDLAGTQDPNANIDFSKLDKQCPIDLAVANIETLSIMKSVIPKQVHVKNKKCHVKDV